MDFPPAWTETADVAEPTGKQIMKRTRILLSAAGVIGSAFYVAYVVWAFRVEDGAMRWFLVLLPLVVGGAGGYKWFRDYRRWMKE